MVGEAGDGGRAEGQGASLCSTADASSPKLLLQSEEQAYFHARVATILPNWQALQAACRCEALQQR